MNKRAVFFTKAEVQSGLDRIRNAEGLITQLPVTHNGRNTWLMNYGTGAEAQELRAKRGLIFMPNLRAAGYLQDTDK
jgi:hypothetical protein